MQGNLPNDPSGKYDALGRANFASSPPARSTWPRCAARRPCSSRRWEKSRPTRSWPGSAAKPAGRECAGCAAARRNAHAAKAGNSSASWRRSRPTRTAGTQGPVVIDSPQLLGKTDRLEAFVERPVPIAAVAGTPAGNAPRRPRASRHAPPARRSPPMSQTPGRRFDVKGRSIQIKLVPVGDQLAVSDAAIERQAHLEEILPNGPAKSR